MAEGGERRRPFVHVDGAAFKSPRLNLLRIVHAALRQSGAERALPTRSPTLAVFTNRTLGVSITLDGRINHAFLLAGSLQLFAEICCARWLRKSVGIFLLLFFLLLSSRVHGNR